MLNVTILKTHLNTRLLSKKAISTHLKIKYVANPLKLPFSAISQLLKACQDEKILAYLW